ncbi:protoheme IX farnesyltransferase [bacterium]|nr:protoheme IX farnesyltransferase [bacterium]
MKRPTERLRSYLALTKPTIQLLVVLTGAAGLVVEGSLNGDPSRFTLVLLLLAMAGGSANAFNQVFERDVDADMTRTRRRRPLPMKRIGVREAYAFAGLVGTASIAGFWLFFNLYSALLAAGTILFYSLFYTLYLKPRTPQNIVLGGAAGAMGPVIAWAAAANSLAVAPWLMFAIIFFWTPPHFWTLAIYHRTDYETVGYPMMPVIIGDARTWVQVIRYSVLMIAVSLGLLWSGLGLVYAISAIALGGLFMRKVVQAQTSRVPKDARGVFGYSILYLLALFTMMIVDAGL